MKARPRRNGDPCVRLAVALALAGCAACSHLPFVKKAQGPANIAVKGKAPLTVPELQFENLRFADNYTNSVAHASDRVAKEIGTRDAQLEALKWKLEQATAAYVDATGQNPLWNALDLVGLATVSRMVIEDASPARSSAARSRPCSRPIEAWKPRRGTWPTSFSSPRNTRSSRTSSRNGAGRTRTNGASPASTSGSSRWRSARLLALDRQGDEHLLAAVPRPFAGLDPTTVAIEQSRELAARTVAYAERMPTLLRWQAELLAIQVARQPDPQELMADIDRVSHSLESVSKTVEGVPTLVDEQRKAAIDQLLRRRTTQREALLADLDAREGRLRALMGETRQTLDAGARMSDSLKGTIGALDAFVHYVSPPPDPHAPPSKPAASRFDPLDYGKAASEVGGMARDLSVLLASVDKTAPQLGILGGRTAEDLKGVVDRAFWKGIVLVAVLLVGAVFAALGYRALARRLFTKPAA